MIQGETVKLSRLTARWVGLDERPLGRHATHDQVWADFKQLLRQLAEADFGETMEVEFPKEYADHTSAHASSFGRMVFNTPYVGWRFVTRRESMESTTVTVWREEMTDQQLAEYSTRHASKKK